MQGDKVWRLEKSGTMHPCTAPRTANVTLITFCRSSALRSLCSTRERAVSVLVCPALRCAELQRRMACQAWAVHLFPCIGQRLLAVRGTPLATILTRQTSAQHRGHNDYVVCRVYAAASASICMQLRDRSLALSRIITNHPAKPGDSAGL